LACSSSKNKILRNKARFSGDGIYLAYTPEQSQPICCQNNFNTIQDNDASFAGANSIESDFGVGNKFIGNICNNSNFGLWLGYSIGGNIVSKNTIMDNLYSGIAVDHGQNLIIENNFISGNGYGDDTFNGGIYLYSDLQVHYPASKYACLAGYDQRPSAGYVIAANFIINNAQWGLRMENTTSSVVYDNFFNNSLTAGVAGEYANDTWSVHPMLDTNIIGGNHLAGNFYIDYHGCDRNNDGIGDTEIPYTNGGKLLPGDFFPLTNEKCHNFVCDVLHKMGIH